VQPRQITDADFGYWADYHPQAVVFAADDPTFNPCPALVTCDPDGSDVGGGRVVRVPWQLSEIDLMHLARGGTLWLSTWGGLPPHQLEVSEPVATWEGEA
jgi:hypothetical protein